MQKRRIRFVYIVLMSCLIVLWAQHYCVYASIPSNVHSGYLSGNYVKQEKSNWCWVASAENACICTGNHDHNQYFAVYVLKGTHQNPYPNYTGSISESASAVGLISSNELSFIGEYNSKTFSFLAEEIYTGYPVITAGGYYNDDNERQGGHAVLTIGWTNAHSVNEIVYFDSSGNGSYHTCTFEGFCNGTYNTRKYDQTAYHS